MKVIESKNDLELFLNSFESENYLLIPILSDHIKHGYLNRLSLLYLSDLQDNEAILAYNHDECESLDSISHQMVLDKINNTNIFILDKKNNMFLFPGIKILYDIELMEYIRYGEVKTDFNVKTTAHRLIYRNFYNNDDINTYVPLVKQIEYFDIIKDKALKTIFDNSDVLEDESYINYNNIQPSIFGVMESNGVYVNQKYKNRRVVYDNLIYPKYDFNTKTGRPSCTHHGLNFLSMNKNDGSREMFESRFNHEGRMLLIDYKSRHLYLIADMLKETFKENPHTYLGKIYLGKKQLTEEEYEESKKITYQILYGGVPKEFEKIKFFKKIKKLMDELYKAYNNDGFLVTPIYKRKMYKSVLGDLKRQKLFNYYFQAVETEYGMNVAKDVIMFLNNYETKCILYIYDSFLLDFYLHDGREMLDGLVKIISQNDKYPITIKEGVNYNKLNEVFIK